MTESIASILVLMDTTLRLFTNNRIHESKEMFMSTPFLRITLLRIYTLELEAT